MNRTKLRLLILFAAAGLGLLIFKLISQPRTQGMNSRQEDVARAVIDARTPAVDPQEHAAGNVTRENGHAFQPRGDVDVSSEAISRLPLSRIPGGALVASGEIIRDVPVGAEGLGEIFTAANLEDQQRAERLARVALHADEEPEVRQEALDQWLKLLPEESEALLVALAKDERLSEAMAAILVKDTLTRGELIQAEVAFTLVKHKNQELRQLAAEQLAQLTGKNHGDDAAAWSREIQLFLTAQKSAP